MYCNKALDNKRLKNKNEEKDKENEFNILSNPTNRSFMILFSYFSSQANFIDYLDSSITLIKYLNKIKRQISGNLLFSGEN